MTRTIAFTLLLAVAGCSSSGSTSPKTGGLTVNVSEPTGVVGAVTIKGPGGFSQTITATQRLALAPGSYTITAANVTTADAIVGTMYASTVTGSPAVVSVGVDATANVTYTARTGSGGLWISGGSQDSVYTYNATVEYTASQLRASSQVAPNVKLSFAKTGGTAINDADLAFDPAGNLWIANADDNTLVEYSTSALATSGTPTPAVTIQLPTTLTYPGGLAFDANGNLWVVGTNIGDIGEFTPSQLAASGAPTPVVTLTLGRGPIEIAFDAQSNLWVADYSQSAIVEFTPSQLAAGGSATPVVTITGPSLQTLEGIAFDKAGNLWVANLAGPSLYHPMGTIVGYAAASLKTTGSPAPMLTLTPPPGQIGPVPTAVAFDDSGNLWFADLFNNWVGEYTAAALAAGGNPSPAVTITSSTGIYFAGIAFNPHPAAVPLH